MGRGVRSIRRAPKLLGKISKQVINHTKILSFFCSAFFSKVTFSFPALEFSSFWQSESRFFLQQKMGM